MKGKVIQLDKIDLNVSPHAAFALSRLLGEMAMDTLSQTDNEGNYRQTDCEFANTWSHLFELYGQAMISRLHIADTNELATSIAKERGI